MMPITKKRASKPADETALRDQFAMAAMNALLAEPDKSNWTNSTKHFIASDAYAIADAMLAARAKKGPRRHQPPEEHQL